MIVMLYLLGFGTFTSWRGFYWIVNAERASTETNLYFTMHQIFSLAIWGAPFALSGALLIISALTLPYYKTNKTFLLTFTIGHLISVAFYYIFTLAGFEKGLNLLTPIQNLTLSVMCGAMAFIGGVSLWNNKRTQK